MNNWPNVAIWSLFRDNAGEYIENYIWRVNALDYPHDCLRFYAIEGDSTDDTLLWLQAWAAKDDRVTIIKADSGREREQYTSRPVRLETLYLTTQPLQVKLQADPWPAFGMLLESDLHIKRDLLKRLVVNRPSDAGAIAPMVWINEDGGQFTRFYDTWAFRHLETGKRFEPYLLPWYLAHFGDEPIEVNSVGSCVLFDMAAVRAGAWYTPTEVIVGFCAAVQAQGRKVYCDPSTHIYHPDVTLEMVTTAWRNL
jgi:hypothetical protein